MKTFKIIIISLVIISVFSLAFYKEDTVNIEGKWIPEKIILNDEILFPTKIDSLLRGSTTTDIIISEWTDSLYIISGKESIASQFEIQKNKNGNQLIYLTSKEKALNGIFNLKVDTLFHDSVTYEIKVEIQSNSNLLKFKKILHIKPWEPEYPRKGAV
jgi:hypothetical protein